MSAVTITRTTDAAQLRRLLERLSPRVQVSLVPATPGPWPACAECHDTDCPATAVVRWTEREDRVGAECLWRWLAAEVLPHTDRSVYVDLEVSKP